MAVSPDKYLAQWRIMADRWNPACGYTLQGAAPHDVDCRTCWDTGICAECLGDYPNYCPENCKNGTCGCPPPDDKIELLGSWDVQSGAETSRLASTLFRARYFNVVVRNETAYLVGSGEYFDQARALAAIDDYLQLPDSKA